MSTLWLLIAALLTMLGGGPVVQGGAAPLRLELALNKTVYVVGESVAATVTARHEGRTPLGVQFNSGQRFDLIVRRRGALIWRWSNDKAFIQVVQEVSLRPGETMTFQATWDQLDLQGRRVEPGEYEMIGVFLGRGPGLSGGLETVPLSFRVAP